jgi:hypothetical protein
MATNFRSKLVHRAKAPPTTIGVPPERTGGTDAGKSTTKTITAIDHDNRGGAGAVKIGSQQLAQHEQRGPAQE